MRLVLLAWPILLASLQIQASENEVLFSKPVEVEKSGTGYLIHFEVLKPTDVTVSILDDQGRCLRHLAAGVLDEKRTPPPPLIKGLSQHVRWDGKDDSGRRVSEDVRVSIRAGIRPELTGFLGASPQYTGEVTGVVTDHKGNLFVMRQEPDGRHFSGSSNIAMFDKDGKYIRQIYPFPAHLPLSKVKSSGAFKRPSDPYWGPSANSDWLPR